MHPLLRSQLTHREIITKTGIECTPRQMARARRGEQPALDKIEALLSEVQVDAILAEARLIEHVQTLISKANRVLALDTHIRLTKLDELGLPYADPDGPTINHEYMKEYKEYIDLKVIYNKLGKEPRGHKELLRLHQMIREKHKVINERSKMPEMSK